ncbi:sugar/nucleoside kinase (ribokinase family) [Bradyrhizobium sp. LB1.3]
MNLLPRSRASAAVSSPSRAVIAGVSWYENGQLHQQAAFAVDVVDTTGAGDVFHGTYALAIGVGLDVRAAMAFSAATAAMKCRHAGGRNGIPTINECLAFMRTKP